MQTRELDRASSREKIAADLNHLPWFPKKTAAVELDNHGTLKVLVRFALMKPVTNTKSCAHLPESKPKMSTSVFCTPTCVPTVNAKTWTEDSSATATKVTPWMRQESSAKTWTNAPFRQECAATESAWTYQVDSNATATADLLLQRSLKFVLVSNLERNISFLIFEVFYSLL